MFTGAKLPSYAYLSEEVYKSYPRGTNIGRYALTTEERGWRDRYQALLSRGYQLRPRYHPDWTPSWRGTRRDPTFCEDSIPLRDYPIIDATCVASGAQVVIKLVRGDQRAVEVQIASVLIAKNLLNDPRNHCVPVLEAFSDTLEPDSSLVVMPYLYPFNSPPFSFVGEVLDFVQQTLEGLYFLHGHGVAHRDCAAANIMMDGSALYPEGHHPVRRHYSPDALYHVTPLHRIDNPVKYYFIDFGTSSCFLPGEKALVTGRTGKDRNLPELCKEEPYDPFKADIFILGNLYRREFIQKYHDLDFLHPLVSVMTQKDPKSRPDLEWALGFFRTTVVKDGMWNMRSRIHLKDKSVTERVVNDAAAFNREAYH